MNPFPELLALSGSIIIPSHFIKKQNCNTVNCAKRNVVSLTFVSTTCSVIHHILDILESLHYEIKPPLYYTLATSL